MSINPRIILVNSTWEKLGIHVAALAIGGAVAAAVAGINQFVGDPASGIPLPYALAVGAFLADFSKTIFVELEKLDPEYQPEPPAPSGPQPA